MKYDGLRYPNWQSPLQEAILELDPTRLAQRIQEVENLIFERRQAISSDADNQDERQALIDGGAILRGLKKEILPSAEITERNQ